MSLSSFIPPTVKGILILACYPFYQIGKGFASFMAGSDIEKDQFISSLFTVGTPQLLPDHLLDVSLRNWFLYGLPVFDVQARYDSFC